MHALKVLEFDAVLEKLAGHCETELGREAALAVRPSLDANGVAELLAESREAWELLALGSPPPLSAIRDLRGSFRRAAKGGDLAAEDLYRCGAALAAMRRVRAFCKPHESTAPRVWRLAQGLVDAPKIEERVLQSVEADGTVLDTASPALGQLRRQRNQAAQRIVERIQTYTSGKLREYLSDPIYTVRDGRYVVPLRSEHRGKLKGLVHDVSSSGQTLFVEPEEIVQLGNKLRESEALAQAEERRILLELSSLIGSIGEAASGAVRLAADLDLMFAKVRMGDSIKGVLPTLESGHRLRIVAGKHPLLDPATCVPLDIDLGNPDPAVLITGPNTGGKTVSIKTVGLFALMAQSGMAVPAKRFELGPFTQFWADIGDEQSLQQSLSTFSAHVRNIADALKNLKPGALVLLDEIGAGTDPAEGAALAKAILLALKEGGASIVASTHYGELKVFAYSNSGFRNAAMEFDSKTLRPTYRLLLGAPGASHALKIAERYGIPKNVIEGATEQLSAGEQEMRTVLLELEASQKQARKAQGDADRMASELKRLSETAERKLREAEEVRRTAHERARSEVDSVLRELRLQAADLFEELKRAVDPKTLQKIRGNFKALQAQGEEEAARFAEPSPLPAGKDQLIERGVTVRVQGFQQVGTVVEDPKDGKAIVQLGALKMTVATDKLLRIEPERPIPRIGRQPLQLSRAQNISNEVHLRRLRAEEAEEALTRYLDDAILAGLDQVRIVHGKGEGVLRQLVRAALKRHAGVQSFRDANADEGGQGVTIAVLKR